ncbi:MAG: hypothetical protein WC211_10735 [Dehalococcoidia bacterium]
MRRRPGWLGGAVALIVVLAGVGIGAALYLLRETPPAAQDAGGTPTLAREAALLTEPRADATSLGTLAAGTAVQLIGRTQDSMWLYGSAADHPEIAGWLPSDAVRDVGDLTRLTRVESAAGGVSPTQTAGGATRSGPRPDLALQSVGSKQDRLSVIVSNVGGADFAGTILVSLNGAQATRVDVGKPLRPGEALEAVLNNEYVQRRARVLVSVTSPDVTEANIENNRQEVVVGPDQPINLALESAAVDPRDGRLTVEVRNRGPIPLVGSVMVGVRERAPSNRLVVMTEVALEVGAGGVQRFVIASPTPIDLTRMTVSISTDAIADSDGSDDMFPR